MRKALAFPSIDSFCIERDSGGGTGNLRALFENRHFFAIHSVSFPRTAKGFSHNLSGDGSFS